MVRQVPTDRRACIAALLIASSLLACSQPPASTPDASTEVPDAGEPDAGEPPPTWDGVSLERRWTREGFGEAWVVRSLDVDGDSKDEIVVGGRGVGLVDEAARVSGAAPRWSLNWHHDESIRSGGENTWTYAMELTDINGDGVSDAIVLNSDREAYGVDTVTGAELWHVVVDAESLTTRMAMFDVDQDGVLDFFPAGGSSAYSGKTGQKLWTVALPRPAVFVAAGNLDKKIGTDLVITTEEAGCVGICPPPDPNAPPVMNVHVVSTDGQILYQAHVDGLINSLATGDLDGDGVEEVLVGTDQGVVHAIGSAGPIWSVDLGDLFATQLVTGDVDFDGRADIFAAYGDFAGTVPSEVVGIGPDGAVLWRHTVGPGVRTLRLLQLDGDLSPELLVGAGEDFPSSGLALALDTSAMAEPREQWRVDTGMPVDSFSIANIDKTVLLIGSSDSQIRAVALETGAIEWTWSGGGYVFATAAGDLDGDGLDEAISGDDRGLLIASRPSDGSKAWARRMDVGGAGQVTSVIAEDVQPGGGAEVVATAVRFSPQFHGVVEVYDASGTRKWSALFPGEMWKVVAADLDGDGAKELVTAERGTNGVCAVRVLNAAGMDKWNTDVSHCDIPTIDVGDIDGDGKLEIAYGEQSLFTPPHVALLDSEGNVRWNLEPSEAREDGAWVRIVPGGVVQGGFATDQQGHVTLRSAETGEAKWQHLFAPPEDPLMPESKVENGSFFGTLVPDQNEDGVQEIAVSTNAGEVHLVNGATGEVIWTRRLEPLELPWNERHSAGPIAYVPATRTVPPFLAVGQSSRSRTRAKSFVLKLDGTIVSSFEMEGEAHGIAVARFASGAQGVAIGAGLDVHAVQASK